jgi:hypothetical protein
MEVARACNAMGDLVLLESEITPVMTKLAWRSARGSNGGWRRRQPTDNGKAAITGDFVLAGEEVTPVIKALRKNGIEVTAIHTDRTAAADLHAFWAHDDALKLARGVRAALDKLAREAKAPTKRGATTG